MSLLGQTPNTSLSHALPDLGARHVRSFKSKFEHASCNLRRLILYWVIASTWKLEPNRSGLVLQGVRAVISQNEEISDELKEEGERYQETYLHYADRGPEAAGFSQYPGDARAALAPFLAARHLQNSNFKWILFGDGELIHIACSISYTISWAFFTQTKMVLIPFGPVQMTPSGSGRAS